MLPAAAGAIADVVSPDQLNASYIVPSVFDEKVVPSGGPGRGHDGAPATAPGGAKVTLEAAQRKRPRRPWRRERPRERDGLASACRTGVESPN